MGEIFVQKADGRLEHLDYNKIRNALRKAGASGSLANEVVDAISPKIYQNIPTKEIYRLAFEKLSELRPGAAARFGLRSALLALGPDGYPFETFIGALLKGRGYQTRLRQILQGRCIQHEIDVVAERGEYMGLKPTKCIVECKFHNSPHYECHIQSALYSWARFLDVKEQNPDIDSAWLVTNTKFSRDVITYSDCVGLKLLGWSFPENESIQVRIEENKLYPITLLPHLDRRTFLVLHEAGIILAKELLAAPDDKLRSLRIREKDIQKLKSDAKMVLSSKH
ncbi:MAG: ATP cone domain-containing protein [Candidatus Micrarchaeota archaeon]|nr:ATP cone domain-containing protein [Candidatus Micrarchaeota archaeon]